jgi:hypothetical protein
LTRKGLLRCTIKYCWLEIDFDREKLNGRVVASFGDEIFVLDNGDMYQAGNKLFKLLGTIQLGQGERITAGGFLTYVLK